MTIKPTDSSQEDGGDSPTAPNPPPDNSRDGNKVFKSGPLFLSSKGIGWTSWKKRWFILTRTSLVFYRSDPSAVQKGSEVNLTLGGIDLNNTGSVVVKSDKKLLTVLFPDGRDGRAFTLKAETMEDLYEWKIALEEALALAPSGTYVMGQNGVFRNDLGDGIDGATDQSKEKQSVKSLVVGRPVLLALEEIDGTPSFLEKALQFIEDHGVKVEGILRQAADVDDVERRIREYEQGKADFSADEDAHVIADCVKYVIRELPSSPVPASCCKALLEACRTDRSKRLAAMREAIYETFPEPNRKLLQRILSMMQTVASHKDVNRMSSSAVAACMAPLLLRPLLAGDCELENDFDLGGDGSVQLLQAAAAANHAQAIVVTLLEEYESIFGGGVVSTELYSDTEESGSESEELTDDDDDESYDEDDEEDDEFEDSDVDEDFENASNGTHSDSGDNREENDHDEKESNVVGLASKSNKSEDYHDIKRVSSSSSPKGSLDQRGNVQSSEALTIQRNNCSLDNTECDSSEVGSMHKPDENPLYNIQSSVALSSSGPGPNARRPAVWGRTPGKKNLSMESIELPSEDEPEFEKLEIGQMELEKKLAEEVKGNATLQESLEKRKTALYKHRLILEQDVVRLREQLQKERKLREVLEAGTKIPRTFSPTMANIDEKTKADFEEIARVEKDINKLNQTARDLGEQLYQQREQNYGSSYSAKEDTSQQSKWKEKGKSAESKATLYSSRRITRNEGAPMHNLDHDKVMKQHADNLRSKKSHSMTSASFNPKKIGTRGEGAIPTPSTFSKLTNRLNFLKERRSQIAHEIHSLDNNQVTDPSEQSSRIGRGSDLDKLQELETAVGKEGRKFEDTDISRGQDSCFFPNADMGRLNDQSSSNLERGKSESFPNAEKGRRPDDHPHFPPRTYSR